MRGRYMLLIGLVAGCSPAPEVLVVEARDLGPTAEVPAIQGRDGGYSARSFGRSIWLFGDTILSEADSRGSSWRHNSWSWTQDFTADDGLVGFEHPIDTWGGPAEFFPYTTEEWDYNEAHAIYNAECEEPCGARVMLWPAAIVPDAARHRTLVFYGKYGGEPGEWNFWSIGASVAVWSDFEFGPVRPILDAASDEPTLLFRDPEPMFGAAAVLDEGWIYAFACEGELTKPCLLARVDPDVLFERDQWTYWNGDEFGPSLDDAVPVFEGHTILSVHYNRHLERWLAIYSEPLGNDVMLRTAERIEGPWSRAVSAFRAEPSHDSSPPYSALGHSELAREGGRFEYVSYYRATGDWTSEVRLVEVRLDPP